MHDNVRVLHGAHSRSHHVMVPRLPAAHVSRPRLFRGLLSDDHRLSLICAPAGYGKSVLLAECIQQASQNTRIVWLDLLGYELQPEELLRRLAAALEQPYGEGNAASELAQLVGRIALPTWIVLDDYPRIASEELDACLEQLLERSPHTLRWWVGTRRRPKWRLPRLILQGGIREFGAQDLAFNEQELHQLALMQELGLTSHQVTQLLQQSDGWPAGICLQLLEHASGNRKPGSADLPLMLEYLEREVLEDLSSSQRQVLSVLAHIPRFSADLFDYLLASEGGEQMLAQLVQRQLLICSLEAEERWYRLPRPMISSLQRQTPEVVVVRAHRLACEWFAERGMVREAVEHALLAGQPEIATSYLQRYGEDQLLIGESVVQLLRWREELPAGLFFSTPRLVVLQTWALIICTRLDEAERCIAELARFLPAQDAVIHQRLLVEYLVVMGVLHRQRGLPTAKAYCQEALALLSDEAWSQRILCHQALAQQAAAELDLHPAQEHCLEALKLARQHQNLLFEALLGIEYLQLLMMRGECEMAQNYAEQVLQRIRAADVHGPVYARLLMVSGYLLVSQGDYPGARGILQEGIQAAEDCEDAYLLFGYLGLAQLAAEDGQLEQAEELLHNAEQQMLRYQVPEARYREVLDLARGELHLRGGQAKQALAVFSDVRQRLELNRLMAPSGFYDLLLKTRLSQASAEVALDNVKAATDMLRALLDECLQRGHLLLATQVRIRLAEALERAGENLEADEQLVSALLEAQGQQQIRPVELMQRREEQWLDQLLLAHQELSPLRKQLLRFSGRHTTSNSAIEILSKRELMVLELIAKGHSNQQVADILFISLHTVKSHARRINARLGVARRTQAVALAREQGWIE